MRYLCFFVLGLLLYACETAVEVDVPRYPAQLTVNALFNPDSVWQVELTQNRYILDTARFAAVPDAEVRVTQQGQLIASLRYQGDQSFTGNSFYVANDSRPQAGEEYTLEVTHPTLGNLTARSAVPASQTMIVSAVLDTLDVRQDAGLPDDNVAYAVTIRLDDPPEENFYSLSILLRWEGLGTVVVNDRAELWIENEASTPYIRSDDPIIDNPFDSYRTELLFKDVSFSGQTYELKFYMSFDKGNGIYDDLFKEPLVLVGGNAYDRQGNVIRVPGDTFNIHTLYAVLRTTTEDYYNYNYTRDLQASVENNPFAQPVQVFDNVEGGLGVFAGYSQTEKEVTIK